MPRDIILAREFQFGKRWTNILIERRVILWRTTGIMFARRIGYMAVRVSSPAEFQGNSIHVWVVPDVTSSRAQKAVVNGLDVRVVNKRSHVQWKRLHPTQNLAVVIPFYTIIRIFWMRLTLGWILHLYPCAFLASQWYCLLPRPMWIADLLWSALQWLALALLWYRLWRTQIVNRLRIHNGRLHNGHGIQLILEQ